MVTNGRVIPLEDLQPLLAEDFRLLDQYANTAQVAKQVSPSAATGVHPCHRQTPMLGSVSCHQPLVASYKQDAADGIEQATELTDECMDYHSVLTASSGPHKIVCPFRWLRWC